jgi:hypothetical protein
MSIRSSSSISSMPNYPQNQIHKSFELISFVDKLPLQIECITCYDNIFLLGTNSGRILIYEVKSSPMSQMKLEASFEKTITVTKKPIQQLEAIKEFNLLLALFDSQLHVIDLKRFQLQYSLTKTKNSHLFATSVSNQEKDLLRLVVACKRKLQFYYLNSNNSKFMELMSDLELNDVPRTLELTRDNLLIFSLRKEFFYYELPPTITLNLSANKVPELKFSIGNRNLDPLCEKLYNGSFIVGVDENKTILYDSKGK